MKRFLVRGHVSLPVTTIVSATSAEEAKKIARRRRVGLRERAVHGWEVADSLDRSGDTVDVDHVIEGG